MSDGSRPDPSSPAEVSGATFSAARKGYDQHEVREFLRQVANELMHAREREAHLEKELRQTRDDMKAVDPVALDEDTVTRLLGEEAARILQTARESGAQIRIKAEEGAARLLREASEEAKRQRQEADLEIARRRHDTAADVDEELALAKQQGREMVEEARAYRERVVGELGRRRQLARQQIDQLVRSRDRLVQAFERARLAASDVIAEVAPLEAPDDDIDISSTTGPIPLVPASTPDDSAVDASAFPGESEAAGGGEMYNREDESGDEPPSVPGSGHDAAGPDDDAWVEELLDGDAEDEGNDATIVPFPGSAAGPTAAPAAVEDLFARLRAGSEAGDETKNDEGAAAVAATPAADDDDDDGDDGGETPFTVREVALVPVIVAAARKVKRVLADEQNEVLDALRRNESVNSVDEVVPGEPEQSQRYATAIADELAGAASAGATSITGGAPADGTDVTASTAAASGVLGTTLVAPLRERLARCIDEAGGDNEVVAKRVRAVYREWKTQRIDEQLEGLFRSTYAHAAFEAIAPGTPVAWIVDPDGPPSPDCEDNSLVDRVVVGDTFPTGQAYPPAHPGCRCLLTRVPG